jgi:hypothetical protein
MKENPWARLLAYVTGLINQELLLKNEYLAAENRILRAHLPARPRLSDPEGATLAASAWGGRRCPNVLKRHGIAPAPKRSQNATWKQFIPSPLAVLAGIDFFTVEVPTWRGLVTY